MSELISIMNQKEMKMLLQEEVLLQEQIRIRNELQLATQELNRTLLKIDKLQKLLAELNKPNIYESSVVDYLHEVSAPDSAANEMALFNQDALLPRRGQLLRAVQQVPLLGPLLVAPLPKWRNPPPVQPLRIPLLPINGCDMDQRHIFTSAKMCSSSMLNFRG